MSKKEYDEKELERKRIKIEVSNLYDYLKIKNLKNKKEDE